jgi:hypothetical protein
MDTSTKPTAVAVSRIALTVNGQPRQLFTHAHHCSMRYVNIFTSPAPRKGAITVSAARVRC